ncbi:hypothetical protein HDV00_012248 [Rhizophlyctis rosea]|nr:hypothetical protein HDV00_012248 [Rhizophlyctis rosea]
MPRRNNTCSRLRIYAPRPPRAIRTFKSKPPDTLPSPAALEDAIKRGIEWNKQRAKLLGIGNDNLLACPESVASPPIDPSSSVKSKDGFDLQDVDFLEGRIDRAIAYLEENTEKPPNASDDWHNMVDGALRSIYEAGFMLPEDVAWDKFADMYFLTDNATFFDSFLNVGDNAECVAWTTSDYSLNHPAHLKFCQGLGLYIDDVDDVAQELGEGGSYAGLVSEEELQMWVEKRRAKLRVNT